VGRIRAMVALSVLVAAGGCGWLFPDRMYPVLRPADVKQVAVEVVARGNRCEPAVLAVDREGRAVLVTFQVATVGKEHVFLIPDLHVRRRIPADSRADIELLADRSGIYEFACNSQPFIGPFVATGKLAVK
jgi:plastocyanin domain-containing protein